jgi:hypothetical protein
MKMGHSAHHVTVFCAHGECGNAKNMSLAADLKENINLSHCETLFLVARMGFPGKLYPLLFG